MTDSFNQVRATITSKPELREVYYEEVKRQRTERAAHESVEEERRQRALRRERRKEVERLMRMSPAEAWMSQHEEAIDAETAPTRRALQELVYRERLRFKAARERLREMGIR